MVWFECLHFVSICSLIPFTLSRFGFIITNLSDINESNKTKQKTFFFVLLPRSRLVEVWTIIVVYIQSLLGHQRLCYVDDDVEEWSLSFSFTHGRVALHNLVIIIIIIIICSYIISTTTATVWSVFVVVVMVVVVGRRHRSFIRQSRLFNNHSAPLTFLLLSFSSLFIYRFTSLFEIGILSLCLTLSPFQSLCAKVMIHQISNWHFSSSWWYWLFHIGGLSWDKMPKKKMLNASFDQIMDSLL